MNAMTEPLLFKQTLAGEERELVSFATHASRYRHWTLSVDGDVARLKLDIDEDGGIKPGYKLKLIAMTWASTSNCMTRSTASASSIPPSRSSCSKAARTASGARARTSICWACPRTPGR